MSNDLEKQRLKVFKKPSETELKARLSAEQFAVTQESATEPPFRNQFWNHHEDGIYVDIVSGEALFSSLDKFDSGCGWPSFMRPLTNTCLTNHADRQFGMVRTEVRSKLGDSHLGHVFDEPTLKRASCARSVTPPSASRRMRYASSVLPGSPPALGSRSSRRLQPQFAMPLH